MKSKRAFTLIELLVVIAIIAILASLLLPTLGRAKYTAMRSACLNNMRQQYLSQIMYADDFGGRFPNHNDVSPDYQRTGNTSPRSIVDVMRKTYVQNTQITLCPITRKSFAKDWPHFGDPSFAFPPDRSYGGWDSGAPNVYTTYMWMANFPGMTYLSPSGAATPNAPDREPAWPTITGECDSRRAFITHRISDTPGTALWDLGHLGKHGAGNQSKPLWAFSITPDQPVGLADGSVAIYPKNLIKPRARGGPSPDTTYYY